MGRVLGRGTPDRRDRGSAERRGAPGAHRDRHLPHPRRPAPRASRGLPGREVAPVRAGGARQRAGRRSPRLRRGRRAALPDRERGRAPRTRRRLPRLQSREPSLRPRLRGPPSATPRRSRDESPLRGRERGVDDGRRRRPSAPASGERDRDLRAGARRGARARGPPARGGESRPSSRDRALRRRAGPRPRAAPGTERGDRRGAAAASRTRARARHQSRARERRRDRGLHGSGGGRAGRSAGIAARARRRHGGRASRQPADPRRQPGLHRARRPRLRPEPRPGGPSHPREPLLRRDLGTLSLARSGRARARDLERHAGLRRHHLDRAAADRTALRRQVGARGPRHLHGRARALELRSGPCPLAAPARR